jgi:hypothetical protein
VPASLPAHLSARPFSVGDARALDIGPDRLRRGDLSSPHHGVRSTRHAETLVDRCRDVLPVLPAGTSFSHTTALELWHLPLPRSPSPRSGPAPLHVLSTHGGRVRRPGVAGHEASSPPTSVHRLAGVPVVDPVTAWVQCAALLDLDALVAVADALAGRWSTWTPARLLPLERLDLALRERGGLRAPVPECGPRRRRRCGSCSSGEAWAACS